MSTVTMINSVDEHFSGEEVDLPDELADLFIIKGYAEGQLSRDYDESERVEILADQQTVEF
jgi:hypothetical protein